MMTVEGKASVINTVVTVVVIAIAAFGSYFTISAKADQALADVSKVEARVKAIEEKQARTASDISEMKTDIRWIKDHLQKGR